MVKRQHKARHVPERSCVVCRQKTDKRQLIRLVKSPDAGLLIDVSGKHAGRGAYLCKQTSCWRKAISSPILEKALRATLTDADKQLLATHLPTLTTTT